MDPNRSSGTLEEQASHGRGFRWIAIVAGLAVLGVAGAAAAGLAFPGLLTTGTLAIGLTATTIVLGLAIVVSLAYLDRAFISLDDHHEAAVNQRESLVSAREEAWERHEEIRRQQFGQRIDELQSRLNELDAELASVAQQSRRTSTPTPFGDIHEAGGVDGIHEQEAAELTEMGIRDTEQLWMANAKRVADRLGRDPQTVRRWQHQAELMALPTVSGSSAGVLARGGIHTIGELASWDPDELADQLAGKAPSMAGEPEDEPVSRSRLDAWIENARAHDPTAHRVHRGRGPSSTSTGAGPPG